MVDPMLVSARHPLSDNITPATAVREIKASCGEYLDE